MYMLERNVNTKWEQHLLLPYNLLLFLSSCTPKRNFYLKLAKNRTHREQFSITILFTKQAR